jgi:hypothetical protein
MLLAFATQHVARRNRGNAQSVPKQGRLGSFAATWRTE